MFTEYTIGRALKYFKLAESRGFKDEELYSIMAIIMSYMGQIREANAYAAKFLASDQKKGLPEGTIRRIYAQTRLRMYEKPSPADISAYISDLERAVTAGDDTSKGLLLEARAYKERLDNPAATSGESRRSSSRGGVRSLDSLNSMGASVACNNGHTQVITRTSSGPWTAGDKDGVWKAFDTSTELAWHVCQ